MESGGVAPTRGADGSPVADVGPTGGHSSTATLSGRRVFLRPPLPEDYRNLYMQDLSPEFGPRWRFKGSTPGYEAWTQALWANVLVQFLVTDRLSGEVVGRVVAANPNLSNGHCSFSVAKSRRSDMTLRILDGAVLALEYLFRSFPIRKVYMQVMEYNLAQMERGLGLIAIEEGRLRQHEWLNGMYWDEVHYAIYRESWDRWSARLVQLTS